MDVYTVIRSDLKGNHQSEDYATALTQPIWPESILCQSYVSS